MLFLSQIILPTLIIAVPINKTDLESLNALCNNQLSNLSDGRSHSRTFAGIFFFILY